MNQQPQKKKTDIELMLSIFFIVFGILILVLAVLLTVSALRTPKVSDTTGATKLPVNPPQSAITLPHTTDRTEDVADAIDSQYAVLLDAQTGEILASKNATEKFNPASMTKVMTLIVLCENLTDADLEREVTVTEELRRYVSTGAYDNADCFGFSIGTKVKVVDLLYGIGIRSVADSTMLAIQAMYGEDSLESAEQKLVALMNQKVQELGLKDTHFDNVIGHESENNYSTASDMAAIMMYALDCPLIVDILSCDFYRFYVQTSDADGKTRMTYYSTLFNANSASSSRIKAYEKEYGEFTLERATFLGGKTGSLENAPGQWIYSLVTFAEQDGKTYVAVTGETAKNYAVMKDAKTLYDNYIP